MRGLTLGSLAMLGACNVSVDYSGTVFSCELDGLCPGGQQCVLGICQQDPIAADADVDGQPTPDGSIACIVEPASCDVAHCIPNTVCSVVVDGVVDEFAGAPSIVFQLPTGGNTVTVRPMWDAEALYLAFEVEDAQLTGTETADDAQNFLDDCVHWFLDGEHNGGIGPDGTYMLADDYHGIVSVLGARYDEQGDDANPGNPDSAWSSDEWLSAVTVNGSPNVGVDTDIGMTVEVKIPWSTVNLAAPSDMALLGLGLGHSDTDGDARVSGLWLNLDRPFQNAFNWQTVRLRETQ